jgi:hypothetical protein
MAGRAATGGRVLSEMAQRRRGAPGHRIPEERPSNVPSDRWPYWRQAAQSFLDLQVALNLSDNALAKEMQTTHDTIANWAEGRTAVPGYALLWASDLVSRRAEQESEHQRALGIEPAIARLEQEIGKQGALLASVMEVLDRAGLWHRSEEERYLQTGTS